MVRKRIIVYILSLFLFTRCIDVQAIIIKQETDGYNQEVQFDKCDSDNSEGCIDYSQNLVVRASLVGPDGYQVAGTKTIEFTPWNPYNGQNARRIDGETIYNGGYNSSNSRLNTIVPNNSFIFTGSTLTGDEVSPTERHQIYMGFGETNEATDDFSTYTSNRKAFISYVTSLEEKKIKVESNGKVLNINFIDYFLNVCGFVADWNATDNAEVQKKLAENHYYIFIEPVFEYGIIHDGERWSARGTAKQLANFAVKNKEFTWFWVPYDKQIAYNHFCSFIEKSGLFNFGISDEYLCGNVNNFDYFSSVVETFAVQVENVAYKMSYSVCEAQNRLPFSPKKDCDEYARSESGEAYETVYYQASSDIFKNNYAARILQKLADSDIHLYKNPSGFGVNVIDLSDVMKNKVKEETIKNTCTLEINSCKNNNFTFTTKLKSDDLFDCVYPSSTYNMKNSDLQKYFYNFPNSDLWCYDDLTYSFSSLSSYYNHSASNNYILDKNQVAVIPQGTLTVNRTCFSKKDLSGSLNSDLDNIFKNDIASPIGGTQNNYQQNFYLDFNGTTITYLRGDKYQTQSQATANDSGKQYKQTKQTSAYGEEYYVYKSSFTYPYYANIGYDITTSSIKINDYNIIDSLGNSNSIDLDSSGFSKGTKVINIPSSTVEGKYIDEIRTISINDTSSNRTEIINGYGYSTNIYNKLSEHRQLHSDDNNNYYQWGDNYSTESSNGLTNYKGTTSYILDQTSGKYCTFETEIIDKDIIDEGVQFRIISLTNPFPARDGTSRLPGKNWLNDTENNVKEYIQNNRGVLTEAVYTKEPMYKITLDAPTMIKIREYNKEKSYTDLDLTCEEGTGRMCISNFLRNELSNLEGTCTTESASKSAQITKANKIIDGFLSSRCNSSQTCLNGRHADVVAYDKNNDGLLTEEDYQTTDYYTCADKTAASGG